MGLKRRVRGKGTLAVENGAQGEFKVESTSTISHLKVSKIKAFSAHATLCTTSCRTVGALLVTNPEKVQLIQPPMRIMGSTLVTFPFIMSVSMLGSVKKNTM